MSFDSDVIALLPVLRRYAHALTGDTAWADDLVQDAAERALSGWSSWRAHSNLRAWLFTILRNLYIDQLRKQRETMVAGDDSPWNYMAAAQEVDGLFLRDVQRALYCLPADQREVLLLVGLEEFTYEEASRILKIPLGTVMSRLSRARERMHALMHVDDPKERAKAALKVVRSTP